MSHLVGEPMPVQKVTIVSRGQALGYTLNTPQEDRYLHTKDEFLDLMKVMLGGRAAEQIVFGAVTNGAANDLERVTDARAPHGVRVRHGRRASPPARCAPTTTRSPSTRSSVRDEEQARLTDHAYSGGGPSAREAPRTLDLLADAAAREGDAPPPRAEELLADVPPESNSSDRVGTPRVVSMPADPNPA